MKPELEYSKYYNVIHRTWDNKKQVKAKRQFIMMEDRFGEIPCYVFTTKIQKGKMILNQNIISIPHYDLISCELTEL